MREYSLRVQLKRITLAVAVILLGPIVWKNVARLCYTLSCIIGIICIYVFYDIYMRWSQSFAWFATAEEHLQHSEDMLAFPKLPLWKCTEPGCQVTPPLYSCHHIVKLMFHFSEKGYEEELKQARVQWHPDKFTRCGEHVRKEIMEAVEEFAKILNGLWDDLDET